MGIKRPQTTWSGGPSCLGLMPLERLAVLGQSPQIIEGESTVEEE